MIRVALVGVAALAAVAGASAGANSAASSPCTTRALVVWLSPSGAAAGSAYYKLELTNLGAGACTLYGYPGVSAVDLAGRQLGDAAARDASRRPRLVTVDSGATASATLQIVDAGNISRSTCRPLTAAGLRVYPPGQRRAKVVPYPFLACSRRGPNFLIVHPVRR